jgi:SAM-dependent methyltransferase
MNSAQAYKLSQLLGFPTTQRYRAFVRQYVAQGLERRVLEIGCGVGSSRRLFLGSYTGVDINPDYVRMASRKYGGNFYVIDAGQMPFDADSFDDAVSIATAHHLSDAQLTNMVSKAVIVASRLHIIDPILPLSASSYFKRTWFRMDRGRFTRTLDQLCNIVDRCAHIEHCDAITGPLHDVCYIRASRKEASSSPIGTNGVGLPS